MAGRECSAAFGNVAPSATPGQDAAFARLYGCAPGRALMAVLTRPFVSKAAGWVLDRGVSRVAIGRFARGNGVDLSEYQVERYRSFNEFFTRRIRPEARPVDADSRHFIAPCDARLTVCPIAPDARFTVKGCTYTFESLTRDAGLAARFQGGQLLLFRLTVGDYHRYCHCASGMQGPEVRIPGVFHTVNPSAAAARAIYQENTREYALVETLEFGTLLVMEVGALLVGRIVNYRQSPCAVRRGAEKGRFEFGGSTIIVCVGPGAVRIDDAILANSAAGLETQVRYGERIGIAQRR